MTQVDDGARRSDNLRLFSDEPGGLPPQDPHALAETELKWLIAEANRQHQDGKLTERQAGRWQLGACLVFAQEVSGLPVAALKPADELLDAILDLDRDRVDPLLAPPPRPKAANGAPKGGRPLRITHAELDELSLAAALVTLLVHHAGMTLDGAERHVSAEMSRRGAAYPAARIRAFRKHDVIPTAVVAKHEKAAQSIEDEIVRLESARAAGGAATVWRNDPAKVAWAKAFATTSGEPRAPGIAGSEQGQRAAVSKERAVKSLYRAHASDVEEGYMRFRLESWLPPLDAALLAVEQALNDAPRLLPVSPSAAIAAILDRSDEQAKAYRSV